MHKSGKRAAIQPAVHHLQRIRLAGCNAVLGGLLDALHAFRLQPQLQQLHRNFSRVSFIAIQGGQHLRPRQLARTHVQRPVAQPCLALCGTQRQVFIFGQCGGLAAFLQATVQRLVGFIKTQAQGFKLGHKGRRHLLNAVRAGRLTGRNQPGTISQPTNGLERALRDEQGQRQGKQNGDRRSNQHHLNRLLPAPVKGCGRLTHHSHPTGCASNALKGKHDLLTFQCLRFEGAAVLPQLLQALPVRHRLADKAISIDRAPQNAACSVGDSNNH